MEVQERDGGDEEKETPSGILSFGGRTSRLLECTSQREKRVWENGNQGTALKFEWPVTVKGKMSGRRSLSS